MKYKLLFALLFAASTLMANQVVFDPATYEPDSLPDGMSIVEVEGISYCQIVLNGWNSVIPVEDVIVDPGRTHFRMQAKFAIGASDTLTVNEVNTFLKLANFRAGNVEIGAAGAASSSEFQQYMVPVATEDTVTVVQVAGQETISWGAVTGDTLWIGKVELITYDPDAVLDPGSIDPDSLPAGMDIEMINGSEYVRIVLNGWNTLIPVENRIVTSAASHFRTDAKLAIGASDTLTIADVNTFLKLGNFDADPQVEIGASGAASSADFTTYTVSIATQDTITHVQVAGQETTNWGAVIGDTLWVGKLVLLDLTNPSRVDNLLASIDGMTVTLSWDEATDNDEVASYLVLQDDAELGSTSNTEFEVGELAEGTYTFGVRTVDASGNMSSAEEIEVVVGGTAVEIATDSKVSVYPNPAHNNLYITGAAEVQRIQVISMTGAVVMDVTETHMLNVTDLKEGLYLIKIRTSEEVISTSFVKD